MLRVIHLPKNIGGHPAGLAAAERAGGVYSEAVVFGDTKYGYVSDGHIGIEASSPFCSEMLRWYFLFKSIWKYDVFHFNFGQKILTFPVHFIKEGEPLTHMVIRPFYAVYSWIFGTIDLRILKFLGKKIVVTFQGDDVRQGDVVTRLYDVHFGHEVSAGYYQRSSDERKRQIVGLWDRYADRMYALNPDLLRILPKRASFFPYAHVEPADWIPVFPAPCAGHPLKIVHAPSDRKVKGTQYLIEAVERLKAEGLNCELVLVEGVPHADAKKIYGTADIVVDQLLAGWYGGFGVEAMALGKPVVAYLREADFEFVPTEMINELPVISATPHTIGEVLKVLILDPCRLKMLGMKSREFVERWHSQRELGCILIHEYHSLLMD